jgi:hypothetical protein
MDVQVLILIVIVMLVLLWTHRFLHVEVVKKNERVTILAPAVTPSACQPPPVTGRVKITTANTQGDSNCGVRLGDIYEPLIGQPFSATWNDAKIPQGGYILTWGPTGLFYGLTKARMFGKNLAVITQRQFEGDGNGFAISRGGIVACDCCGDVGVRTPFTVTPIRNWREMQVLNSHRDQNEVRVEFETSPQLDTYVVAIKMARDSTLQVMRGVPNAAYHGIITNESKVNISLPSYDWTDGIDFGQYALSFVVQVFGYKLCDVGNSASVRAGNLASFVE